MHGTSGPGMQVPARFGMSFASLRLDQLNDVIGQPKASISQPDQTIIDRPPSRPRRLASSNMPPVPNRAIPNAWAQRRASISSITARIGVDKDLVNN